MQQQQQPVYNNQQQPNMTELNPIMSINPIIVNHNTPAAAPTTAPTTTMRLIYVCGGGDLPETSVTYHCLRDAMQRYYPAVDVVASHCN